MTYDIISALLLIAALIVVHRSFDLTNWLNPFVIFFWFHVVFLYAAIFYRSFYADSIEIDQAVIILIWVGMLMTTLGAVTARLLSRGNENTSVKLSWDDYDSRYRAAIILLLTGLIVAAVYYFMVGSVPLLAEQAEDFRIQARRGKGILILLSGALMTYAVYTLAYLSASEKRRTFLFAAGATVAVLAIVGFGNRAPALELILFATLTFLFVRDIKLKPGRIVAMAIVLLVLMALLGIVRQGLTVSSLMIFLQIIWRPFANIQNLQWVYDAVPAVVPYLYGMSYLIDLAVVLPGHSPNFGTWFKEQTGQEFAGGSVTVSYLGEIYANFGWVGVVPLCFVYGFMLVWLFSRYRQFRRSNDFILLLIWATTLKGIVSSGIVSVLLYQTMMLMLAHFFYSQLRKILRPFER